MRINGYRETGTTTTPWTMLAVNQTDRFTLAEQALEMGAYLDACRPPQNHGR